MRVKLGLLSSVLSSFRTAISDHFSRHGIKYKAAYLGVCKALVSAGQAAMGLLAGSVVFGFAGSPTAVGLAVVAASTCFAVTFVNKTPATYRRLCAPAVAPAVDSELGQLQRQQATSPKEQCIATGLSACGKIYLGFWAINTVGAASTLCELATTRKACRFEVADTSDPKEWFLLAGHIVFTVSLLAGVVYSAVSFNLKKIRHSAREIAQWGMRSSMQESCCDRYMVATTLLSATNLLATVGFVYYSTHTSLAKTILTRWLPKEAITSFAYFFAVDSIPTNILSNVAAVHRRLKYPLVASRLLTDREKALEKSTLALGVIDTANQTFSSYAGVTLLTSEVFATSYFNPGVITIASLGALGAAASYAVFNVAEGLNDHLGWKRIPVDEEAPLSAQEVHVYRSPISQPSPVLPPLNKQRVQPPSAPPRNYATLAERPSIN